MAGAMQRPQEEARRAWVAGIGDEAGFLRRWSGALRPEDEWARFQHLAARDAAAAARQLPRLDPAHRAAAEARLALQRDAPNADALLAAVPEPLRRDPGLMLDRARWLRRVGPDRGCARAVAARRRGRTARRAGRRPRRLLDRAQSAGPPPAARRQCRGCLRAGRSARTAAGRADAGRGVPGRLHRAAPAERPRRGDAALQRRSPICRRPRSPRPARITGWAAPPPRRAPIRNPNTTGRRPGRPRSMASLPRSRLATMPRRWRAASPRCTIPPTPASRCWRSPIARWCAPRRCWWPGTIRTGRAPSCCAWTSSHPIRPIAR